MSKLELKRLLSCLGRPAGDAELEAVLAANGLSTATALRLPDGLYSAHLQDRARGLGLSFTDEAMVKQLNQVIGVGPLHFEGIFLYADGEQGYSGFTGELPHALDFDMVRDAVLAELGQPSWYRARGDGSPAVDRWDDSAPYRIHLSWSRAGQLRVVFLHLPCGQ